MTNLEKLAEGIRQKWPAPKGEEGDALISNYDGGQQLYVQHICSFYPAESDQENAPFIIWGLDRLEELGWHPSLLRMIPGGYQCVIHWSKEEALCPLLPIVFDSGDTYKTRAEAVCAALARALEVE